MKIYIASVLGGFFIGIFSTLLGAPSYASFIVVMITVQLIRLELTYLCNIKKEN